VHITSEWTSYSNSHQISAKSASFLKANKDKQISKVVDGVIEFRGKNSGGLDFDAHCRLFPLKNGHLSCREQESWKDVNSKGCVLEDGS
jgi:hypothetical protein